MTEQQIQTKRIKQLEAEGYYVLKLIKTPKGKVSPLQEYRLKELKEYGFLTEVYRGE
jgi:hypothetical protein